MSQLAEGAQGTVLKISSDTTTSNYVTFPDVELIDGPSMSGEPIDVTTLDSGRCREFKSFISDNGELTFNINYVPTNTSQKVVLTAISDTTGGVRACRIDIGGSTSKSFVGLACVSRFSPSMPVGGKVTASVTLKATGVWTHP